MMGKHERPLLLYFLGVILTKLCTSAIVGDECFGSVDTSQVQCASFAVLLAADEGFDGEISLTNTTSRLHIYIRSNSDTTESVEGYNVSIKAGCSNTENITVIGSPVPQDVSSCSYTIMPCNQSTISMVLRRSVGTSSHVAYVVELNSPSDQDKVEVKIYPNVAEKLVIDKSFMRANGTSGLESSAESCDEKAPEIPSVPFSLTAHEKAGMSLAIVFGVFVILVAVAWKITMVVKEKQYGTKTYAMTGGINQRESSQLVQFASSYRST